MSGIGVHFANQFNSTFFTNCCNAAICDDQENCPHCGVKVIPKSQRWEACYGKTRAVLQQYFEKRRKEDGLEQAARVAARLKGEAYVPPQLCLMCGKPIPECYC